MQILALTRNFLRVYDDDQDIIIGWHAHNDT